MCQDLILLNPSFHLHRQICRFWPVMCEVMLGCRPMGTQTSPFGAISNQNRQQLMTQFHTLLLFYFSPVTLGWFSASWSQVGLIQPTASMTSWTCLDSHEEWANKSVMYDSHLRTRTCTHSHTLNTRPYGGPSVPALYTKTCASNDVQWSWWRRVWSEAVALSVVV